MRFSQGACSSSSSWQRRRLSPSTLAQWGATLEIQLCREAWRLVALDECNVAEEGMTADLEWLHRAQSSVVCRCASLILLCRPPRQTPSSEGCHLGRKARRKQKAPSRLRQEFAPSSLKRFSSRESGFRELLGSIDAFGHSPGIGRINSIREHFIVDKSPEGSIQFFPIRKQYRDDHSDGYWDRIQHA